MKKIVLLLAFMSIVSGLSYSQTSFGSADFYATTPEDKQIIDRTCLAKYAQDSRKCDVDAGDDDQNFYACRKKIKEKLVECCKTYGGSDTCAIDAE
jgi:hypothetical protein